MTLKQTIHTEEELFEKVMLELPVNDYRIFHEDLITGEKRLTFRGAAARDFLRNSHARILQAVVVEIEGMMDNTPVPYDEKADPEVSTALMKWDLARGGNAALNRLKTTLIEAIKV